MTSDVRITSAMASRVVTKGVTDVMDNRADTGVMDSREVIVATDNREVIVVMVDIDVIREVEVKEMDTGEDIEVQKTHPSAITN
jgi:hypothetical protein